MAITDVDIEQAKAAMDAALADITKAEAMPPGEMAGALWAAAKGRRERAEFVLSRLEQQRDAERGAVAAWAEAEKSAGKRVTAVAKELEGSRDRLTEAITAAQDALVAMVAAAASHDALVRSTALELAELGLALADGDEHETGGTRKGFARLRGQWWAPINGGHLLAWLGERVRATRVSTSPHANVELQRHARQLGLASRADLQLDKIPIPDVVPRINPFQAFIDNPREPMPGAPVYISKYQAALDQRQRDDHRWIPYRDPTPTK